MRKPTYELNVRMLVFICTLYPENVFLNTWKSTVIYNIYLGFLIFINLPLHAHTNCILHAHFTPGEVSKNTYVDITRWIPNVSYFVSDVAASDLSDLFIAFIDQTLECELWAKTVTVNESQTFPRQRQFISHTEYIWRRAESAWSNPVGALPETWAAASDKVILIQDFICHRFQPPARVSWSVFCWFRANYLPRPGGEKTAPVLSFTDSLC